MTAIAAEGEEVELVAEGHLAVRADGFYVADRHFAETGGRVVVGVV